MKKTIIAPVGDHLEDLFVGIREFETEKVILVSPKDRYNQALETKESLDKFKIPSKIIEIDGHLWEEIFKSISNLKEYEVGEIIILVSTGDRNTRCAATSAAFVNGFKAFAVDNNEIMMLPVLKFSYYNLLTPKKMSILSSIKEKPKSCISLDELSKEVKMSLPLVSYHINGNLKSEGLKEMGLVQTKEQKGKISLELTSMAKMLLNGYVKEKAI